MASQTVQALYNYVLDFLDLDSGDIDQNLANFWIQEAYDDLTGDDTRWPWFEIGGQNASNYGFSTVANQQVYELPAVADQNNMFSCTVDVKKVVSVGGPQWELQYMGVGPLESSYVPTSVVSSQPTQWSTWGDNGVTLWPIPDAAYVINVRAYREPADFIALGGVGGIIDGPPDFSTCVQQYVLSNAWSQQSDLQQAAYWMQNYLAAKERLKKKYLRATPAEGLVLNGGRVTRNLPPRIRYPFEPTNWGN